MLKILFVDDEPKVLDGLRRNLRTLRREWTAEFAAGALEALQMLESNSNFDVVVTDLRMPGMDGLELLRRASDLHPNVLRIVLSGGYEREDVVRSSGVHEYLSKPCSLDNLRSAIVRAASLGPC